ncbi:hypothetical protein RUM43_009443 [Polyplax serrata]|uniref:Uncharacterized protein n=1 Tax=Polyplax serrata TaxID=468196 RepID=A0AAN8NQH5_POLSC
MVKKILQTREKRGIWLSYFVENFGPLRYNEQEKAEEMNGTRGQRRSLGDRKQLWWNLITRLTLTTAITVAITTEREVTVEHFDNERLRRSGHGTQQWLTIIVFFHEIGVNLRRNVKFTSELKFE